MNTKPYKPYSGRKKRRWLWALLCLLLVGLLAFAALEVYIGVHSRTVLRDEDPEVMVIFGCQVMPWGPSVLLQDRLDTALDYLSDHPDIPVVVTGGKGDNEHLSEARCMYDYLTAHGIDGQRILMEDRSTDTWENVRFTRDLLVEHGMSPRSVLLVSNGFHLSRVELLWGRAWGDCTRSTLAAPTSHQPSAVKMFFREPLALVKSFLFDH